MAKNKKIRNLIILLILVLTLGYFASTVEMGAEADMKYKKVLIIGIDGMDHKVTKSLISADMLPTFKNLAQEGSFLKLETSNPAESPVAWVSISTGTNPGKHNIFDFLRRDPKTYVPQLSLSKPENGIGGTKYKAYAMGDPFWKLTSKSDVPTTIIRWPVTFPPEKVNGKMFSGLGVPDIRGFLSGYTYYTTEGTKNDKVILVEEKEGIIETQILGPKKRKSGKIVDVSTPMKINLNYGEKEVQLNVDGKKFIAMEGEWSEWVRVPFKVGFFNKVDGLFKVFLESREPFRMYITSIQINPENPLVDISYPGSYSKELVEDIGLYYTLGLPEETDGYVDEKLSREGFIAQTKEIDEEKEKMFWKEFANFNEKEKGVYAFVFDTSDRLQHLFWNERVLEKSNGKLSLNSVVYDYYKKKDDFLKSVLEQVTNETLVLIISDHGFTSFERAVNMNTWLVANGFMSLTQDLEPEEESPLFGYVDWKNTKAYSLGFSSIYINLKGRESQGFVENKEEITGEIIKKLKELIDPKTGEKVVHEVYRKEDIYNGEYLENAPDLIIGFKAGYRMSWQTAVGGFGPAIIEDNEKKWSGDHLVDPSFVPGVLFANRKFNKSLAHQMDVAPTILDALGVVIPAKIDGNSLLK